jgi:excinuclease ABC subunit B
VVDQVVRPTGLLDPPIEIRPTKNQVDNLLEEIRKTVDAGERVLVTTLTKRMAEELAKYFDKINVRCRYIHSEVQTLDRIEILRGLREGEFDVLIGVNLLREGLDLPEVSLVAIMDADKEGFLRSNRSLTQTAGRAARNINGRVIFYADKITDSMKATMSETERRRNKQIEYNELHGITPRQVKKDHISTAAKKIYVEPEYNGMSVAADPLNQYLSKDQLQSLFQSTKKQMEAAARELDFLNAARLRDEMFQIQKQLEKEVI